jgi:hypothetical protein
MTGGVRIVRIHIENFRGISLADIYLNGTSVFLGDNNTGKSTSHLISSHPPVERWNSRAVPAAGKWLALVGVCQPSAACGAAEAD